MNEQRREDIKNLKEVFTVFHSVTKQISDSVTSLYKKTDFEEDNIYFGGAEEALSEAEGSLRDAIAQCKETLAKGDSKTST